MSGLAAQDRAAKRGGLYGLKGIVICLVGAVDGAAAFALLAAITIDLIVLSISIVSYYNHLGILVATAVFFAAIGFGISSLALHAGGAQLAGYAEVSVILSVIGLAAAGADYFL